MNKPLEHAKFEQVWASLRKFEQVWTNHFKIEIILNLKIPVIQFRGCHIVVFTDISGCHVGLWNNWGNFAFQINWANHTTTSIHCCNHWFLKKIVKELKLKKDFWRYGRTLQKSYIWNYNTGQGGPTEDHRSTLWVDFMDQNFL